LDGFRAARAGAARLGFAAFFAFEALARFGALDFDLAIGDSLVTTLTG
jgi:hypothetical protein